MVNLLKDFFSAAFVSGFIAGVVKDLFDAFSYYIIHFVKFRYLDLAAVILYGEKPYFWWDTFLALFTELMFSGVLGIIFAYLLSKIKTENLIFKGFIYGVSVWIFLYTMGYIFDIAFLRKTAWQTVTSNMITSAVYGIVLALTLKILQKKKLGEN